MLGALIGAGTQVLGGILGARSAKKAQKRAEARDDTAIQRRVADSLAAGVHPLFGLGASVSSSQPVVAGQVGDALRESGQDIGRAVDSYRSQSERSVSRTMQALQLKRMGLENDLIETQIRSEQHRMVGSAPGFPETGVRVRSSRAAIPGQGSDAGSQDKRNPQRTVRLDVGVPYETNPRFTDAASIEDRYGDSEIVSMLAALGIGGADAYHAYMKSPYRFDRAWSRVMRKPSADHARVVKKAYSRFRR